MVSFLFCALLSAGSSGLLACSLGRSGSERYWIGLAVLAGQLGTTSMVCSALAGLEPATWLAVHATVCLVCVTVAYRLRRSKRHRTATPADVQPDRSERPYLRIPRTSWLTVLLSGGLACVLAGSGLLQWFKPVNDWDSRMYHGSRCLYWIQNRSLFPFETHNDRQTDFPFGGELMFLWPVLFTHLETAGRMVFWLGFPLSVLGCYLVLRELSVGRNRSLAGALLFAATPTVLTYAMQLKPEFWATIFVEGTVFWMLRACRQPERGSGPFGWAGVCFALAISVRSTVLVLAPALCVLPWLLPPRRQGFRRLTQMALGAALGIGLSGVFVVLAHNVLTYGHPLGSPRSLSLHRADGSFHQVYVHAVRIPFFLFELPVVRGTALRARLATVGNEWIARLGAAAPLPMEEYTWWPGHYTFTVPAYADHFSVGGFLWLFGLVVGAVLTLRDLAGTFPRCQLRPLSALTLLAGILLLGVALTVRWMCGIDRFWIPAYSLGLIVGTAVLSRLGRYPGPVRVMILVALPLLVYCPLKRELGRLQHGEYVAEEWWLAHPYPEVVAQIPAGGHILLICDDAFRDYPLFNPEAGYPNRVIPWGQRSWDEDRFQQLRVSKALTHVVISDDGAVGFMAGGSIHTAPIVRWLTHQPGVAELPSGVEHLRLFELGPIDQPVTGSQAPVERTSVE